MSFASLKRPGISNTPFIFLIFYKINIIKILLDFIFDVVVPLIEMKVSLPQHLMYPVEKYGNPADNVTSYFPKEADFTLPMN